MFTFLRKPVANKIFFYREKNAENEKHEIKAKKKRLKMTQLCSFSKNKAINRTGTQHSFDHGWHTNIALKNDVKETNLEGG